MKPCRFYHVYNHANGTDNLFHFGDNYIFFLQKLRQFISPVAHIHAYCLMPNHFHLLISIRDEVDLIDGLLGEHSLIDLLKMDKEEKKLMILKAVDPYYHVNKQFSNFFNSYCQAYNKVFRRKGSLFIKNFKYKEIEDNDYLINVVKYIHKNPVHHHFTNKMEDWEWSSYRKYKMQESYFLSTQVILELFGGYEQFIEFHENPDFRYDYDFL